MVFLEQGFGQVELPVKTGSVVLRIGGKTYVGHAGMDD